VKQLLLQNRSVTEVPPVPAVAALQLLECITKCKSTIALLLLLLLLLMLLLRTESGSIGESGFDNSTTFIHKVIGRIASISSEWPQSTVDCSSQQLPHIKQTQQQLLSSCLCCARARAGKSETTGLLHSATACMGLEAGVETPTKLLIFACPFVCRQVSVWCV
jgi:hypothetical protein